MRRRDRRMSLRKGESDGGLRVLNETQVIIAWSLTLSVKDDASTDVLDDGVGTGWLSLQSNGGADGRSSGRSLELRCRAMAMRREVGSWLDEVGEVNGG